MHGSYCARFSDVGHFPFNQNIRFKFSATSSCERKSIKRGQPREVFPNFRKIFPGSFLSIQLSSRDFWNFRLNGSHFGNSTVSRNFWKLFGTFRYHLPLFPNFRKFWMNGKRPSFRWETTDGVEKSRLFLRVVIPSCLSTMTLNSDTECILPWNRNNVH